MKAALGDRTVRAVALAFWFATGAALVMAVAGPAMFRAREFPKLNKRAAQLRAIASAIDAYAAEHDVYPQAATCKDLRTMVTPKYASSIPCEDSAGGPIVYVCVTEPCDAQTYTSRCKSGEPVGTRYAVISTGRDRQLDERSRALIRARTSAAEFDAAFEPIIQAGRQLSWYEYVDADFICTSGNFLTGPHDAAPDATGLPRIDARYKKTWVPIAGLCALIAAVLHLLAKRMRDAAARADP